MAKDDDSSHSMLYIGIGALAAVGAGYLVWRYLLSDETKGRAKGMLRMAANGAEAAATDAVRASRLAARSAAARASDVVEAGRDSAKGLVSRVK